MEKRPAHILPLIVIAQFAGTSLWFTGNAILPELKTAMHLSQYAVSQVTTAVMLGFVGGTLTFSLLALPDRFSPVRLFFTSTLLGALCNVSIIWWVDDSFTLLIARFMTGFFLAGIYPVGMKIAADWYEKGLGKALGYLVGALVLGTAFPHLLKNRTFELPWRSVLTWTSIFAVAGALIMITWVGDGPYRKKSGGLKWNAIPAIFHSKKWRQAAMGYFGHMWELYTFWGFLPLILSLYNEMNSTKIDVALTSFIIIGAGSIGCVAGGYVAQRKGSAFVAYISLMISGLCCLASPLLFYLPPVAFLGILLIWGLAVIPDSPQFSAMVTQYAPAELRGTALAIYNSIGFAITTISLWIMDRVFHSSTVAGSRNAFLLLAIGAVVGLLSMMGLLKKKAAGI